MQIAIHLGAHRTDGDLILETLQRNEGILSGHRVAVPPPRRARPAIRRAAQAAGGGGFSSEAQDELLVEMLGEAADPRRLVLSYEAFLGIYAKVLDGGRLYGDAGARARLLRDLFPDHEPAFFLAIRNPATFVPAVFEASTVGTLAEFTGGHDLGGLRWTDVVRSIRAACPDVPLTVWCNEDLPLLLPTVLEAVSGVEERLDGDDAVLERVMTEPGLRRLRTYLRDNPPGTRSTWRKVVTAFLGKYADPEVVEPPITTAGWTDALVAQLTATYEDDVRALQELPGITFLRP
ncbi:hypothetical protein [Jannaschia sp. W003]|uniref:hypothetical protein n=1 Tax=Jannaschia sp. W003 TaxID=2867012 RepID=UPI0021A38235|nr:hypothetical protein [Jannaschia sp. W003]UWQ21140.1 hypothetical protein K3554_14375 [Jannaschia sp. W003]